MLPVDLSHLPLCIYKLNWSPSCTETARNIYFFFIRKSNFGAVHKFTCYLHVSNFRGKKFKTQRSSKIFIFSWEIEFGTCINLYLFESWMKWPFAEIFPLGSTKISNYGERANPCTLCKNSLTNPDFEAICPFGVNSYHTSAVVQPIPWQSSFIVFKFQRNRRKLELIKFFLSPRFIC